MTAPTTNTNLTTDDIKRAIDEFLLAQFHKKADKELKQLAKATEAGEPTKIAQAQEALAPIQAKYQKQTWLSDAKKMATQLKFGTHISKGVHPDAKGDNITANATSCPFVGTHTLDTPSLDANGNAAALPLASFFDWQVGDIKIRQLITDKHPALVGAFHDDVAVCDDYRRIFYDTLTGKKDVPATHERNKQLFWALPDDEYHLIIPLFASALSHDVFHKINHLRYSDANKQARDNRFKGKETTAYVSVVDLATIQLGGTKPQNISQLVSRQGGKTYLLPSYPPTFTGSSDLSFAKTAKTIFGKSLAYVVKDDMDELFKLLVRVNKNHKNTIDVRTVRDDILQNIILSVLQVAHAIRQKEAGWSKAYKLALHQKYWLDPKRGELDGEDKFKRNHESKNWQNDVQKDFAHWIQNELEKRLAYYQQEQKKKNKQAVELEFGRAEFEHWQKEFKDTFNASLRLGQGVLT
ncbi:CRISPR type I-F/YPEST-associated protein Csy1 [Moraxella caprae]|uniref:CRISPR type I-F/YPEST-associated protein Csy1 n=1 Tax=Moraxella caprae TaxID=90240 RepID=A0A378QYT0_9GAMM|nr:type I-F CRISPR-associated protein Csy1 [Moraxella caprae]STZ07617.1 CRISPR type I-F/YPEST-associated protein Csy1 [Moraxella caprae]